MRTFLTSYFIFRSEFITLLLQNNLTTLQLFVIIVNCVRISDRPQQAPVVNAVLFKVDRENHFGVQASFIL